MSTTIEANPSRIGKSIQQGKTEEVSLTVRNTSGETQDYRVQPEEEYSQWVDPNPDFFPLHAEDARNVSLTMGPPSGAKLGTHSFDIIVFNDNDESDRVAVPVQLRVPIPTLWWIIGAIVVLVILLLILWRLGLFG